HITQFTLPFKAGLAFKANDADSLAETLDKLISEPKLIEKLGANARKAVEQKFNWDIEMKKVMKAYTNLF
ncbi:MAG: glycosyltransferase, partial [Candidatus Micrarchaeota archaeon]